MNDPRSCCYYPDMLYSPIYGPNAQEPLDAIVFLVCLSVLICWTPRYCRYQQPVAISLTQVRDSELTEYEEGLQN